MLVKFLRGNRGESAATIIIAIFVSAAIMVGLPLLVVASKHDQAALQEAQAIVTETVNTWASKGVITQEDVDNLILELTATGRAYDPEISVQLLDENSAKKKDKNSGTYITIYKTQVLEQLPLTLHEKDTITVIAEPIDESVSDQLSFGTTSTRKGVAQASAMVTKSPN